MHNDSGLLHVVKMQLKQIQQNIYNNPVIWCLLREAEVYTQIMSSVILYLTLI